MALEVNHLPVLTWNALKLNSASIDVDPAEAVSSGLTVEGLTDGVKTELSVSPDELAKRYDALGIENPEEAVVAGKFPIYNEQRFPTGMGAEIDRLMDEAKIPVRVLTFPEGYQNENPITVHYEAAAGKTSLSRVVLHLKEKAEISVIVEAVSGAKSDGKTLLGLGTRVVLEKGAKLDLSVVQTMDEDAAFFHDIGGWGAENSSFTLNKLDLGAKTVWEGLNHTQAGEGSVFSADLGYLGLPGSKTDINYNDVFRGRKADGRMYFKGALMDGAEKVFRGTVDFRQAASGCSGDEQEDVILLGDDIVNKTIPLILGEEEDVEGRHASTIGSLSEDMLFYLETRGIDKARAEELMVRASIGSIAAKIPSAELQCDVGDRIARIFHIEEDER